ncbi:MAG: hypothetical protein JW997_04150, partial [Actinobacteria bacterium]|nr:hypothetical protein [Actinomycetota bacterium]
EAERHEVEEKGVIKNRATHYKVLNAILRFLSDFKCTIEGITFSKIKGAKGNQEYWIYLRKKSQTSSNDEKTAVDYDKIITDVLNRSELFVKRKESF